MLEHHSSTPQAPARVVILGASGFLGLNLRRRLEDAAVPVLALASRDLDLTAPAAADHLAGMLHPGDSVVMFSALTPDKGRDLGTTMRNLRMGETVCAALARSPVAHVVYASSDAVYPLSISRLTESSCAAPEDLYGIMHRTREIMLASTVKSPLAVLRVTMVFGADDTHNSYGPNRFRRAAAKDGKIVLGGGGEETRDHVFVEDAAALFGEVLAWRSSGVLNLATGQSISFDALARQVGALFDPPAEVVHTARQSPVTHRHFDISALRAAFPQFRFTPRAEALALSHRGAVGRS